MTDNEQLFSREYNAGRAAVPSDLEATRRAAQARANAEPRGAVRIYEHVGGRHPKRGFVPATHEYLWRDVEDDDGKAYAPPKWFWQAVETVLPETVQ